MSVNQAAFIYCFVDFYLLLRCVFVAVLRLFLVWNTAFCVMEYGLLRCERQPFVS